ncbi:MAG: MATE family efflux transporter [Deltaproteobacteria bacterium]|nr:MATE family efflux transporter [Deltaproteobacteria bacterium]
MDNCVKTETNRQSDHPFVAFPHKTLLSMSLPVLLSLVAEPLTGLVDTAFVARLGAESLAALGAGTVALSSIFWVFNFLGIGTQTEVAQTYGREELTRTAEIGWLAIALSAAIGGLMMIGGLPLVTHVSTLMGAEGAVHDFASQYIQVRLFGAPAVLVSLAVFGILRGLQDMRTPFWVAVSINTLNIILDPLLIFGYGPFPRLGIFGAGLASVISQWLGAFWATAVVLRRLGLPHRFRLSDIVKLFQIGRDLFVRTGLLTVFFIFTTRAATRIGPDAGAAHQAIRQVWVFTALFLDAFAITGQSLIGFFVGPGRLEQARRVARLVCFWSLATGISLSVGMLLAQNWVVHLLLPPSATNIFFAAWLMAVISQPVNALAFATDGIHWGTGDFRFLRNVMIAATAFGGMAIYLLDEAASGALTWIWLITALWIAIRAVFGMVRIWPGIGRTPLKERDKV